MKFSIIIVTFNRKKALIACLKSIKHQSLKMPYEVIVILNGDLAYLGKYKSLFHDFSFFHIPFTTTAHARNIALMKAQGEYVLFLDEESILPPNYLQNINFNLDWDVLGGPDQSPIQASSSQKLIGRAIASPICMGSAFKRHSQKARYDFNASEENLTISHLWFKRKLFTEEGFQFNKNLFKNEEYYLLNDMAEKGKKFHYNPLLFVYHHRLPSMEKLGAALIKSGKCRANLFLLKPKKEKLIHFSPLLFLIFFSWMIFHPNLFSMSTILIYTIIIFVYDMIHYYRISLRLVLLHYLIQLCYSIGLIKGLWAGIEDAYTNFKANKSFISESKSK